MKPKLLLVDDEPSIHRLIQRAFESEPVEVLAAFNGEEGVRLAEEKSPQLIILDVNMPVLNGYGAIRQLRKNKATRSIPVMMLTSKEEMIDQVVGFELGVEDYITKPFEMRELKKRVKDFLKL